MRKLYLAIALAAIAIILVPAPAFSQSHCAQLQQQINAARFHNERAALLTRFNRECRGHQPKRVQAPSQEEYYGHVDPEVIRALLHGLNRIERRQDRQIRRGH
jgi:hypothetical protein